MHNKENLLIDEKGMGLIVLVLIVLGLTIGAGFVGLSGGFLRTESGVKETQERLLQIRKSIRPISFEFENLAGASYSTDVGTVPALITGLSTKPGADAACSIDTTGRSLTGWCGPYWKELFSGINTFADAWGTSVIYNTSNCTLTSYGPNRASGGGDDIPFMLNTETYKNAVLADRPTLYFRLNETSGTTATDLSTNGRNGTYSGGYTFSVAGAINGDSDTATTFNGSTGKITVTSNAVYDLSPMMTMEVWLKYTNLNTEDLIHRAGWFSFGMNSGRIRLYDAAGSGTITTPDYGDNLWHHIVAVKSGFDSSNITIYVDSAAAGISTTGLWTNTMGSNNLIIAGDSNGYYSGTMDEVALYNYPLSSTRVTHHYKIGKCIK